MVAGYSRTGKTTITHAERGLAPILHGDEIPRSVAWEAVAVWWIERLRPLRAYVFEGVQAPRVLRTGIRTGTLTPDAAVFVTARHDPEPKHAAFRKAIDTVWAGFLEERRVRCPSMPVYEMTETTGGAARAWARVAP